MKPCSGRGCARSGGRRARARERERERERDRERERARERHRARFTPHNPPTFRVVMMSCGIFVDTCSASIQLNQKCPWSLCVFPKDVLYPPRMVEAFLGASGIPSLCVNWAAVTAPCVHCCGCFHLSDLTDVLALSCQTCPSQNRHWTTPALAR